MFQCEVLILELAAIDGLSASSVVVGEVTTLYVDISKLMAGKKSVQ